jgi:tRNA nucleotidyltransferase (CCA-adding enzyme)
MIVLRIFLQVRFAARFDLVVDSNLWEAACDPEVHAALETKVSKERIGTELEGMLNGALSIILV